ncbi:hypothetical protein ABW19_dt0200635 [Dactylella cylindrospora]|nr:hypothetical protein ABW19_dt0200635 [Dactylella cylindrospora]
MIFLGSKIHFWGVLGLLGRKEETLPSKDRVWPFCSFNLLLGLWSLCHFPIEKNSGYLFFIKEQCSWQKIWLLGHSYAERGKSWSKSKLALGVRDTDGLTTLATISLIDLDQSAGIDQYLGQFFFCPLPGSMWSIHPQTPMPPMPQSAAHNP